MIMTTDTGIYYLYNYTPTKYFRSCTEEEKNVSRKIWDYKNGDNNAVVLYTIKLMEAISIISKNINTQKLALVAVPPSKVNKQSSVRTSIGILSDWCSKGIISSKFNCTKQILDFSGLLLRISEISTAHEGIRATYEEQKRSISCTKTHLSRYWATFVILDDVTTIGTSMDVCKNILLENGAYDKYIIRLAIAKTI